MNQLSSEDTTLLQTILQKLKPFIEERQSQGDANLLTYSELYAQLDPQEQAFLDAIRNIKPSTKETANTDFVAIDGQVVKNAVIPRQFLPRNVHEAYLNMMKAMKQDIGRRLYVESGYRSPAYQLYLFMFYMPNHDHSIKETNRWVALPGHSEHGSPERQAIDFINEEGVSGETFPEEFENLPEYAWLTQNARRFGFVLSYPKNNTTNSAFEPWHWRYEPKT